VVDTFYLRHRDGRKLTRDEADRLRVAVLAECKTPNGSGGTAEGNEFDRN
jgi:hypothetical protein